MPRKFKVAAACRATYFGKAHRAYGDDHTYRPVDFDSLGDLLKVFKAALPAFDVSSFPRSTEPVFSILFTDVIELSETKRSILGLEK
jgi:hypothetical protein